MEFPSELRNRVGEGHVLVWDPPIAHMRRWRCQLCNDVVLVSGTYVSGAASQWDCEAATPVSAGALL